MNAPARCSTRPGLPAEPHGEHVVVHESDDVWRRLKAALDADTAEQLLAMFQQEALGLGALESQLEPEARQHFRQVWNYVARWKAEGGPHPELRTRERHRGGASHMPLLGTVQPTYRTRVNPALPAWNDPGMLRIRGRLVGVLERGEVRSDAKAPISPTPETAARRKRLDKVAAREHDVLSALPPAHQAPLKTQIELAQRLARAGSPNWDRRTIARSLQGLRDAGLVDAERLRRTAAGDRRVAE